MNGWVVAIPELLLVKDTETERVKEVVRVKETVAERVVKWDAGTVTGGLGDLVNAMVEGTPELLRVMVPETDRVKDSVIVKEIDGVLVNGWVVAIPEILLVKDPEDDRVKESDLVYEGDTERVFI